MAIDFQSPWWLLLFIPAIGSCIWWWRTQTRVAGKKRVLIVGMRLAVLSLLLLVLAGVQLLYPVQHETVVFVVDRSASMNDDARMMPFLREAVAEKGVEDQFGIVAVGEEAVVEQPISTRTTVAPLGAALNPHASNLGEGIRLAAGLISSDDRGRIVVISDGLETDRTAKREVELATDRGIVVDALSLQQDWGDEVLVRSIDVPSRLHRGEQFQMQVEIESTVDTRGELRFYEGNVRVGTQSVHIEQGTNRFQFPQTATDEGFHRYRVELDAEDDTIQANNVGYAFTEIQGKPRVLVVEGEEGDAQPVIAALQAGDMNVEVIHPSMLPSELDGYRQYASILLANVRANQVAEQDMTRIHQAVQDMGIGLTMTGGANSFGMGGWFDTPIEAALPVDMNIQSEEELPSLALSLVIDRSGSMSEPVGGTDRMSVAREAAIRATDMLNDQDEVGVIAFDTYPWEVIERQPIMPNLEDIQEQIGSIEIGGGTEIFRALQAGYEQVRDAPTQRKHVILLTDGHSAMDSNYGALLSEMNDELVTVSTVAIGEGSDTDLLQYIADEGQGRYYYTDDPSNLPDVFQQETIMATQTFIVEQPHIPLVSGARDWTVLQQALPIMHAYTATTPKQTAETALLTMESDPLLARWQYGLGRTVAWTSDTRGRWSQQWMNWEENERLWNDIVQWTFPAVQQGDWHVQTVLDHHQGNIIVEVPDGSTISNELEAVILHADQQEELIPLHLASPGRLEGTFSAPQPGTYMVQVTEKAGTETVSTATTGLVVPYSPEYAVLDGGEDNLADWVSESGVLLTSAEQVFRGDLPRKWDRQSISEALLIGALVLWVLDIAVRRLSIPTSWRLRIQEAVSRRRGQGSVVWKRTASVSQRRRSGQATAASHAPPPTPSSQYGRRDEEEADTDDPFNRLLAAKNRKR